MSIRQVGILNYFRLWQAYRMLQTGEISLISRVLRETQPHPESRRAASFTTASKTKALRIIFAGKLGSTPAVITLLTANNRNVFISLLIALMRAKHGRGCWWGNSGRSRRKSHENFPGR